jgi:hypothetical protein
MLITILLLVLAVLVGALVYEKHTALELYVDNEIADLHKLAADDFEVVNRWMARLERRAQAAAVADATGAVAALGAKVEGAL